MSGVTGKRNNLRYLSILLMLTGGFFVIMLTHFTPSVTTGGVLEEVTEEVAPDTLHIIRVVAAGDAMAHLPQTRAARDSETGEYCFREVFRYITPGLQEYDLALINLETTLGGKPYRGYPMFSAPDAYARDLHKAGFNLFFLANNHAVDRFNRGVLRTLDALDSLGISSTGTFRDTVHRDTTYPMIVEMNGIRIAILNATYGTNGLFTRPPVLVNMIDTTQIIADMEKAREAQPDFILAVMHWGGEYRRQPDRYQQRVAHFLARQGVDVVVGHHPHVVQPIEWIIPDTINTNNATLVIWSLGNFFSNQRKRYRDGGILASFELIKNSHTGTTRIAHTAYEPFWVYRNEAPLFYRILPAHLADTLLHHYSASPAARRASERFFSDTRQHLAPYNIPEKRETLP